MIIIPITKLLTIIIIMIIIILQWQKDIKNTIVPQICISKQIYYFLKYIKNVIELYLFFILLSIKICLLLFYDYTNREITTTWYYVNSRRNVDSGKCESTFLLDLRNILRYLWLLRLLCLFVLQIASFELKRVPSVKRKWKTGSRIFKI